MNIQNPECPDSQKDEVPSTQVERKMSKNVNFQTPPEPYQNKIASPNLCKMDTQGISTITSKSPLKNGFHHSKQFKEDSGFRTVESMKESPDKMRRKTSINQQTIEMTAPKYSPSTFTSQYNKNIEETKKRNSHNIEQITENDEVISYQRNPLLQDKLQEQAEELKKCRFCTETDQLKPKTENIERDEEEDDDDDDENDSQNEQDEENRNQENVAKKKIKQNELIRICRCKIRCWSHRKCLINHTINNKHKCRYCSTQATFKTKSNKSLETIKSNYYARQKEVKPIFVVSGVNALTFFGYLIFYIHKAITNQEDSLTMWTIVLIILTLLTLYGGVFFLNKFEKLLDTEIDSDVVLEELVEKKKDTHTLITEKRTEGNEQIIYMNNNLFTQVEEYNALQQDKLDRQNQSDQHTQRFQAEKTISPCLNSMNSHKQRKPSLKKCPTCKSNNNSTHNNNSNHILSHQNTIFSLAQHSRRPSQRSFTYNQKNNFNRTLFTDDSEQQSPNDRKIFNNLSKISQKNGGSMCKNSSSSNSKSHSNENIKNNSLTNNKNQISLQSAFSDRFKKPSQFSLSHDIPKITNAQKLSQLPQTIDQEAENKEMKKSLATNSQYENESPFTKSLQLQQDQSQKQELTSRFGYNTNNGSSHKKKSENSQNMMQLNLIQKFKVIGNMDKYKKTFLNHINEESHNSSSINTSNNLNTSKRENHQLKTNINDRDIESDIENQQSKPSLIASSKSSYDENRKSTEDNLQPITVKN